MAGTKVGGEKCRNTNYKLHGLNYYKEIGKKGGKAKVPKGFSTNKKLASLAGFKGGSISRRGKKYESI